MNKYEEHYIRCHNEAMALSKADRQEYLNYINQGKSIGEAIRFTGVSFEAALGIINMNIESRMSLKTESA